jgi:hypothetical protein
MKISELAVLLFKENCNIATVNEGVLYTKLPVFYELVQKKGKVLNKSPIMTQNFMREVERIT